MRHLRPAVTEDWLHMDRIECTCTTEGVCQLCNAQRYAEYQRSGLSDHSTTFPGGSDRPEFRPAPTPSSPEPPTPGGGADSRDTEGGVPCLLLPSVSRFLATHILKELR